MLQTMFSRFFMIVGVLAYSLDGAAQGFQKVFPDQSGPILIENLKAAYKPAFVFNYAMARDTLYARILARKDDSLRCIYSGYTLYLDPSQDPTQYIFQGGSPLGMNTEHAYPQSKGAAEGNARSDMHHLYPARIPVNEARSSKPYADIPDNQTQQWFLGAQSVFSKPSKNIDAYSESNASFFEPRESVKGDVARSAFYIYTVYREQADAADPFFFNDQRAALCRWNAQDPVDSAELDKTWKIAAFQDNKPNPFVIDCSLAFRTWCAETPPNCALAADPSEPTTAAALLQARIVAASASEEAYLEADIPFDGALRLTVYATLGNTLRAVEKKTARQGPLRIPLSELGLDRMPAGLQGFVQLELNGSRGRAMQTIPVAIRR